MFNFCSLYSGSSGNCSFIQTDKTNILVDAGESAKKIENALSSINVSAENIDAIVVTHEHIDHIKSISTLSKKFNIPIYATKETWDAMPKQKEKVDSSLQNYFTAGKKFLIGDLNISPFSIPHDAANPCGFTISNEENKKISIATDLGHITEDVYKGISDSSFILLESNYDPEVLKFSRYPYMLKQRISGKLGHLSNEEAGSLISELSKKKLNSVMLGHLSKENNFPELAYKTVVEELISNKCNLEEISVNVATRSCPSKIIKL